MAIRQIVRFSYFILLFILHIYYCQHSVFYITTLIGEKSDFLLKLYLPKYVARVWVFLKCKKKFIGWLRMKTLVFEKYIWPVQICYFDKETLGWDGSIALKTIYQNASSTIFFVNISHRFLLILKTVYFWTPFYYSWDFLFIINYFFLLPTYIFSTFT